MSSPSILALDMAGSPAAWLNPREAAHYIATGLVAWELGETCHTMRGGINAASGRQSLLELKPIIALRGKAHAVRQHWVPFNRHQLMRRDRLMCAYCGELFREEDLTVEHIRPESRGGETSWMNCVAACKACNNRKDDRLPEEARMPLLYLPYEPNRHESFLLDRRRVLADQMEFLMAGVGSNSRLRLG